MARDALVITGATATGKSEVAVAVAQQLGGEIISMDSRQVYQGMDIGTAKAPMEARGGIPHFGFDVVTPAQSYSAGRFARDARGWIQAIRDRGSVPVLCGGTGFFLRALIQPLFQEPPLERGQRARLKRYLVAQPVARLRQWASVLDGKLVETSRPLPSQRLIRIIEVALLTGRPLSWWQQHAPSGETPLSLMIVVLELPRDVLYARIDRRVHAMMERGFLAEVQGLIVAGYSAADPGLSATGYRELIGHLRGERSLATATALVQAATRRYARRQLTWFRQQLPEDVIRIAATAATTAVAGRIVAAWKQEVESEDRR